MKFRPGVCSGPYAYTKVTIGGENNSKVKLTKIHFPPYTMSTLTNDFQFKEKALGKVPDITSGDLESEGKWKRIWITQKEWTNIVSNIPDNSPLLQYVPQANKFFEDIATIRKRNIATTRKNLDEFTKSQKEFYDGVRSAIALAMVHRFRKQNSHLVRMEKITDNSMVLEMAVTAITAAVSKELNTTNLSAYSDFSGWKAKRNFKKLTF